MKLGVASVRNDLGENRSKYAEYFVVQKRRYYAIRKNCRELLDVSRRMTTLLQRTDISGAEFTPVYLHAADRRLSENLW